MKQHNLSLNKNEAVNTPYILEKSGLISATYLLSINNDQQSKTSDGINFFSLLENTFCYSCQIKKKFT